MYQGVDDLEEVLSERLQQLPAPASRQGSGAAAVSREEPAVVIPDELPNEERTKVGPLSRCLCAPYCSIYSKLWKVCELFPQNLYAGGPLKTD